MRCSLISCVRISFYRVPAKVIDEFSIISLLISRSIAFTTNSSISFEISFTIGSSINSYILHLLELLDLLFEARHFVADVSYQHLCRFGQVQIVFFVQSDDFLPVLHSVRSVTSEQILRVSLGFFQDLHNRLAVEVIYV